VSKNTEELVDVLSGLSVLEMSELKTALEDKWGVKASAAAVAVAAAPAGDAGGDAAEEATDFSVTLTEFAGDKKIAIIKAVREVTGFGLKEAKEAVEGTPKLLKETAPKAEAEEIKKKLEDAGGKVALKAV
jgi:large subunit ribosomal protein L7/L12